MLTSCAKMRVSMVSSVESLSTYPGVNLCNRVCRPQAASSRPSRPTWPAWRGASRGPAPPPQLQEPPGERERGGSGGDHLCVSYHRCSSTEIPPRPVYFLDSWFFFVNNFLLVEHPRQEFEPISA